MTPKNPFDLPLEPQIAPVEEKREEHKPTIEDIEGVLEIIRREEEGEIEERKPTLH